MTTIVVSPYRTLKFLEGGGHFWVYMQYIQGLRQAGCDVYWLERVPRNGPWRSRPRIEIWLRRLRRFGLDGNVILYTEAEEGHGPGDFLVGTRSEAYEVLKNADLLLNFYYAIDPELLACFRRTALVDIDPGLLQSWISAGQLSVAPHDVYFTTGQTAGPGWVQIRPPVSLELWPYTYDSCAVAFTTVTDWWSGYATEIVDGRQVMYDNNKRVSFLAFAELASLTSQPLELAAYMSAEDTEDRQRMQRNGWRIRPSVEVSRTPEMYRSYIQGSRGEISCVKPSYVKLRNGWISDRSLCYLASGKPVVVQRTGLSSYLPLGAGIFEFSTATEAAEALATVNADYEKHCRSAREIAESYFDARRTTEKILDAALRGSP